jgi:hypothetical protein
MVGDPQAGQREENGPNPPRLPAERPGPAGGKRDRNRRERTKALLEAALALFLELAEFFLAHGRAVARLVVRKPSREGEHAEESDDLARDLVGALGSGESQSLLTSGWKELTGYAGSSEALSLAFKRLAADPPRGLTFSRPRNLDGSPRRTRDGWPWTIWRAR